MANRKKVTFWKREDTQTVKNKELLIWALGVVFGMIVFGGLQAIYSIQLSSIQRHASNITNNYFVSDCSMSFSQLYQIEMAKHNCNPVYGIGYQQDPVRANEYIYCSQSAKLVEGYQVFPRVEMK